MGRVNKKDVIDLVSEKLHISKEEARETVEDVLQLLEDTLVDGKEVNFSNFGVLVPIVRRSRIGTDPKKHTKITIQKTKTISFRPSKSLKVRLNG